MIFSLIFYNNNNSNKSFDILGMIRTILVIACVEATGVNFLLYVMLIKNCP